MGGLNGDAGYVYKVYLKIFTNSSGEISEEVFNAEKFRIRNISNMGYRYYDENNNTHTIRQDMLGGVFLLNELEKVEPSYSAYFITDEKDLYDLVTGEMPPKNDEEKIGLEKLQKDMRAMVDKGIEKVVQAIKKSLDVYAEKQESEEEIQNDTNSE